jgi:hypothetical protein
MFAICHVREAADAEVAQKNASAKPKTMDKIAIARPANAPAPTA